MIQTGWNYQKNFNQNLMDGIFNIVFLRFLESALTVSHEKNFVICIFFFYVRIDELYLCCHKKKKKEKTTLPWIFTHIDYTTAETNPDILTMTYQTDISSMLN